ncbi:MAG: hypothetical protein ACR2OG_11775 [Gemmatimonadaceae bacterium]
MVALTDVNMDERGNMMFPKYYRRAITFVGAAASVIFAACRDTTAPPAPPPARVDPKYLAGNAARALGPNGQFILPAPVPQGVYAEISEAYADSIATAFVRGYGQFRLGDYEQIHGARINLAALVRCGRTFYVASAYEPLPLQVPLNWRKAYGPEWMVTFCDGGVPALGVSMPAYDTDVQVIAGQLIDPPEHYALISAEGIPLRLGSMPLAPEAMAELAARLTGRRVTEVPQLVMRPGPIPTVPQSALWRIRLEAPIRVQGRVSGSTSDTDELSAGPDFGNTPAVLFRAQAFSGPEPRDSVVYPVNGLPGPTASLPLFRRPGVPYAYEPVVVAPTVEARRANP